MSQTIEVGKAPAGRRLPIAREGWPFILPPLVFAIVCGLAGWWIAAAVTALVALASAAFFRDPERIPPEDPALVLSPADGVVTSVDQGEEGLSISIFLSVFDVHVNRAPVAGGVRRVRYLPGRYLAANLERTSQENERNEVYLETPRGEVKVTQIAGLIARRIVCRVQPGDRLKGGERFGLIRFGSRTDLRLPPGAVAIAARGDKVRGGLTAVARWDRPEP